MGWRAERRERREQRELRRASRRAEGRLITTMNLIGLGFILPVFVVSLASQWEISMWLVGLAAVAAAVPAAVGLRQLPSAYREHREAKRRLP
jgi:hypothetical protein